MTDTEKLNSLIEYIKDAERCYFDEKATELNAGKISAVQDILLYINHELGINVIK